MTLPYPDDGRVEVAVEVVYGWMENQPNVKHANRRQAARLARLLLRSLYFSGPSSGPETAHSAGNGTDSGTEIRWCSHCRASRPSVYRDIAMRCQSCDFATVALTKPVQQLQA